MVELIGGQVRKRHARKPSCCAAEVPQDSAEPETALLPRSGNLIFGFGMLVNDSQELLGAACLCAEAGQCLTFILKIGNLVQQMEHIQNHFDAVSRTQQFEAAALAPQRNKSPNHDTNAGAVNLRQVLDVQQQIIHAVVGQAPEFRSQQFTAAIVESGLTAEVQNGDAVRFPDQDFQIPATS